VLAQVFTELAQKVRTIHMEQQDIQIFHIPQCWV
jgi:hypothetical protein